MKKNFILSAILILAAGITTAQNVSINRSGFSGFNAPKTSASVTKKSMANTPYQTLSVGELGKVTDAFNVKHVAQKNVAAPVASYGRPLGTYYVGIEPSTFSTYLPIFIGSGRADWTFQNLSTGATSYSWKANGSEFSTETDAPLNVGIGMYYMPELTASDGSTSSTYKYGSSKSNQFVIAGLDTRFPVVNADINTNVTNSANANFYSVSTDTPYAFGTGLTYNSAKSKGIWSIYEKPNGALNVDTISLLLYSDSNIPMPTDGKLSLSVIKLNAEGKITTDTIASSTCLGADLINTFTYSSGEKVFAAPFVFKKYTAGGIERKYDLVINDAFAIVVTGYDQTGFDLGFFVDYKSAENTAYIQFAEGFLSYNNNMNLYFQLHGLFNTFLPVEDVLTVTAPTEGGYATYVSPDDGVSYHPEIYSTFLPVDADNVEVWTIDAPDWIQFEYDDTYFEQYSAVILGLNADALPAGKTGRTGTVVVESKGTSITYTVVQGDGVNSISSASVDAKAAVVKSNDSFVLTYAADYSSVAVYNVAGKLVGNYTLPADGKFTVPSTNLTKGVYLFKFAGKSTQTVKVIK